MLSRANEDFACRLEGFGVTTAQFFYRLPDCPSIICANPLIRQFEDFYPEFPELQKYLEFWKREIDGPLERVIVAHQRLLKPAEVRLISGVINLH